MIEFIGYAVLGIIAFFAGQFAAIAVSRSAVSWLRAGKAVWKRMRKVERSEILWRRED
jgi:hypothetical protein